LDIAYEIHITPLDSPAVPSKPLASIEEGFFCHVDKPVDKSVDNYVDKPVDKVVDNLLTNQN
jgi:hypothetical protein